VHLRGHTNILKRLLIHTGGFNLGLLMRQIGVGTPRGLQGRVNALAAALLALFGSLSELAMRIGGPHHSKIARSRDVAPWTSVRETWLSPQAARRWQRAGLTWSARAASVLPSN
jgi:hypothetical protein